MKKDKVRKGEGRRRKVERKKNERRKREEERRRREKRQGARRRGRVMHAYAWMEEFSRSRVRAEYAVAWVGVGPEA